MNMSLSEMIAAACINDIERRKYAGRTDWDARQFIKRQYDSGKTNFYEVFDFYSIFTPIEFSVWQDIQSHNAPFLPQYPILNYFADFAEVEKKVVIECDGKQHDPAIDAIRDKAMAEDGWTVFRIPGWKCAKVSNLHDLEESLRHEDITEEIFWRQVDDYFYKTSEGIVDAIWKLLYIEPNYEGKYFSHMWNTLEKHKANHADIKAPGWEIYNTENV